MKTTKKHLDYFEKCCRKWIQKFGLTDWELSFEIRKMDDGDISRTTFNCKSRWVLLSLNQNIERKYLVHKELDFTAYHEIIEGVLLGDLKELIMCNDITEDECTKEMHRVVRRLENAYL